MKRYTQAKKCNLHYSSSLLKDNFDVNEDSAWGFDFVCTQNSYQIDCQKCFGEHTVFYEVGNPKYFALWKQPYRKEDILSELCIKTSKPVLVYFPTWDEDCAAEVFHDSIQKLRERFFVVVKLHHCLDRLEICKMRKAAATDVADLALGGNYPFAKAAALADVLLCDAKSGACMEASFLNPDAVNIVLCVRKDARKYYAPVMWEMFPVVEEPSELDFFDDVFLDKGFMVRRTQNMDYYMGKKDESGFYSFCERIYHDINFCEEKKL